ncbi:MAG: lipoprotein signal peptidase [Schleiferiaceae bacterium]|nr:lipoprotein signal peptidase [Schleiferiaceae bacterium]
MKKAIGIILLVLLVDQISKLWIKTNFHLGQEIEVFSWFIIHFTENRGMAWGMEFGGVWGKLALSIFRIGAIIAIGFWLRNLIREKAATVAIVSISLIFAGALGNLIDSAFYGLLFSDSLGRVAEFFPEGGGYAPFLQGSVVDMLYFPLIKGYLPEWVPFKGGDYFIFFRPIFNIADTAISIGVGLLLVFQKKAFPEPVKSDA